MNKRVMFLCLLILIAVINGGCWDKKEFNKISFATAMAVDRIDETYQLTIKVMMPKNASDGDYPVWVVSGNGKSIQDAMDDISKRSPRNIYWSHMDVIILGENVLDNNMYQTLDFFIRGNEFRRRNYFMTTEGKASDLLDISPKLAKINTFYFKSLIEDQNDMIARSAVTLNDVLLGISDRGRDLFIPKLQLQESKDDMHQPQSKEETVAKSEGNGGKEENSIDSDDNMLELKGGALIKDEAFVCWVDEEWVNGFYWIYGNIKRASISIAHPVDETETLSFAIKKSSCDITVNPQEPLSVQLTIRPVLNIVENTMQDKLNQEEGENFLEQIKMAIEEKIKNQVENTIALAKENNVDPFGIGRRIWAYYPQDFAKLDEENYMPSLDISVVVESELKFALIIN